jgi:hypothetical protein
MKRQVQLLGLLATTALLVLVGADDLSMDALFKEDVKTTLDMINRPDGFAGLGDDEDWEAGLDALLETSAKQKGHAASRAKMHAHIEDSIGEAIHEHLQEHLEAGRKENGIQEVAGTVADFFKRLFNCNKCTLGSGNTGQSITKMFTDAAGEVRFQITSLSVKGHTHACTDTHTHRCIHTQIHIQIRQLSTYPHAALTHTHSLKTLTLTHTYS